MSCSSLLLWISAIASIITVPFFSNVAGLLPEDGQGPDSQPVAVIIQNVDTRGGVEVFSIPDRSSGRLFAASMEFQPYAAGQFEDWILIYYFDRGSLQVGWAPLSQLLLSEEELASLPVVSPENMPPMPVLTVNDEASRPYGVQAQATTPVISSPLPPPPTDENPPPQATSAPPGATSVPPTSPPPTSPPPDGTVEVTDQ